jgi:hypothetical protein
MVDDEEEVPLHSGVLLQCRFFVGFCQGVPSPKLVTKSPIDLSKGILVRRVGPAEPDAVLLLQTVPASNVPSKTPARRSIQEAMANPLVGYTFEFVLATQLSCFFVFSRH